MSPTVCATGQKRAKSLHPDKPLSDSSRLNIQASVSSRILRLEMAQFDLRARASIRASSDSELDGAIRFAIAPYGRARDS